MTPENGCLQIMPGPHRQQLESRESDDGDSHRQVDVDPLRCLPIRMRAGDVVDSPAGRCTAGTQLDRPAARGVRAPYHREDVRWFDRDADMWRMFVQDRESHAATDLSGPG